LIAIGGVFGYAEHLSRRPILLRVGSSDVARAAWIPAQALVNIVTEVVAEGYGAVPPGLGTETGYGTRYDSVPTGEDLAGDRVHCFGRPTAAPYSQPQSEKVEADTIKEFLGREFVGEYVFRWA
jgi:hypothetical protein